MTDIDECSERSFQMVNSVVDSFPASKRYANWRRLDGEWDTFHDDWWGCKENLAPWNMDFSLSARILVVKQPLVYHHWGLKGTSGRLVLRNEVIHTYSRLEGAYRKGRDGIVLTGQSGIGKSCLGLTVVLRRMIDEKPCLFTRPGGATYLIDQYGVWFQNATQPLMPDIDYGFDLEERLWSVVDQEADNAISKYAHTTLSTLFAVIIASFDERHYSRWLQRSPGAVLRWILDVWSDEELLVSVNLHPRTVEAITADSTKKAILSSNHREALQCLRSFRETSGPCLRDLLLLLTLPQRFYASVESSLYQVKNNTVLANLLKDESYAPTDHFLIIIRKSREVDDSDDLYSVDIRSENIFSRFHSGVNFFMTGIVKEYFTIPNLVFGEGVLGAWVFESHAISYYTNYDHYEATVVGDFMEMVLVDGTDRRFEHLLPGHQERDILVMDSDGMMVVRAPVTSADSVSASDTSATTSSSIQFAMVERRVKRYISIDSVALDHHDDGLPWYYVPSAGNPLFCAFFFDLDRATRSAVIWVLRMPTTVRVDDGSATGYDIVKEVQAKLSKAGYAAEVRYVLVVPFEENRKVVWELPEAECTTMVAGKVYVQYFDLRVLRNSEKEHQVEYFRKM